MRSRVVGAAAALFVAAAALVLPAPAGGAPTGATPPPQFGEGMQKLSFSVNGSYTPLIGDFDCDADRGDWGVDSEELGIVWYTPDGADFLWTDLTRSGGTLGRRQTDLRVTGTYKPFVGDFDGDLCDDIFWYVPGTAPDTIWWGGATGFTSQPINVAGSYRPVAGWFGGATGADGVFWYAPHGSESIWQPTGDRAHPFRTLRAPQVTGTTYQPSWFWLTFSGTPLLLWYAPGTAPDHLWSYDPSGGSVTFEDSARDVPVDIRGSYRSGGCGAWVVLHGPGTAIDQAAWRNFGVQFSRFSIAGSYRIATTSGFEGCNVVWHAPGSSPDQVWLTPEH